ncbi:MAG: UDP-N-acetylmuramoyl-L-alanine--D-glutamate ligase [Candidatus Omnitrophica bacterium]|nr:UDP-N-acetylmuramoyl-L-alanine--D-glutamate ligase [Candidatus Omnitrophota bacterium]
MRIDNFKKICVIGWGKSGISLANLLLTVNKDVKVSEAAGSEVFSSQLIDDFISKGVEFEFGGHSDQFIKDAQLLILSPGVNSNTSSIKQIALTNNIPCVGEIEFSSWLTKAKIIAITGTNGKTTCSELTFQLLKQTKKRIFLGGNIGTPFSSFVLEAKEDDLIVLEISSFQLETIIEFKPYVVAFLNIEPDHLDRYSDFKGYFQAKLNIFKNQTSQDWVVLNKNIDFRSQIEKVLKSQLVYFSDEFSNQNFSCVYRVAVIFGLTKNDCLKVFSEFNGLEHRLQIVKKVNKITFINDSKATNPSSTIWALKNTKGPIVLLAGGKDKGLDYSSILPYLRKVKKVNLFGEAADKIREALGSKVETQTFQSLEEIVLSSYKEAESGDTILLSPMCSSFDMFSNYQERGDKFIDIVNKISS